MRLQRGLTQIQLAELIGSSQRCISRYETIAELPPSQVIVDLAKALKVTTDELFGLKAPKTVPQPRQDPDTKRLWKRFQQLLTLPERDQRAVVRLINSLVGAKSDDDDAHAA